MSNESEVDVLCAGLFSQHAYCPRCNLMSPLKSLVCSGIAFTCVTCDKWWSWQTASARDKKVALPDITVPGSHLIY